MGTYYHDREESTIYRGAAGLTATNPWCDKAETQFEVNSFDYCVSGIPMHIWDLDRCKSYVQPSKPQGTAKVHNMRAMLVLTTNVAISIMYEEH